MWRRDFLAGRQKVIDKAQAKVGKVRAKKDSKKRRRRSGSASSRSTRKAAKGSKAKKAKKAEKKQVKKKKKVESESEDESGSGDDASGDSEVEESSSDSESESESGEAASESSSSDRGREHAACSMRRAARVSMRSMHAACGRVVRALARHVPPARNGRVGGACVWCVVCACVRVWCLCLLSVRAEVRAVWGWKGKPKPKAMQGLMGEMCDGSFAAPGGLVSSRASVASAAQPSLRAHLRTKPGVFRTITKAKEDIKLAKEWYESKFAGCTRTTLPMQKAAESPTPSRGVCRWLPKRAAWRSLSVCVCPCEHGSIADLAEAH